MRSASLDTRGRYKTEEQAIAATQLLLAAGANINARDRQGQTALYGAAGLGWNGLVEMLASNGIDLQAKDARGRMAIDLTRPSATSSGRAGSGAAHPETEALLRKLMASTASAVRRSAPGAAVRNWRHALKRREFLASAVSTAAAVLPRAFRRHPRRRSLCSRH